LSALFLALPPERRLASRPDPLPSRLSPPSARIGDDPHAAAFFTELEPVGERARAGVENGYPRLKLRKSDSAA